MNAQFQTVGFWMSLASTLVGLGAVVAGLSKEQTDSVMALVGALLTAATSFGYLKAEALVRAAKIQAYVHVLSLRQDVGVIASTDPMVQHINEV